MKHSAAVHLFNDAVYQDGGSQTWSELTASRPHDVSESGGPQGGSGGALGGSGGALGVPTGGGSLKHGDSNNSLVSNGSADAFNASARYRSTE